MMCVITGASNGLGKAIARLITGYDTNYVWNFSRESGPYGAWVYCDLEQSDSIADAAARVNRAGGCDTYHMDKDTMDSEITRFQRAGLRIIQEMWTVSHTNLNLLKSGKKYRYVVFGSRDSLGFDLKLIQGIEKREPDAIEL